MKNKLKFAWKRSKGSMFEACAIFIASLLLSGLAYAGASLFGGALFVFILIGFLFFGTILSLASFLTFCWRFIGFVRKYSKLNK